jgi:multiple sugar transport system permease protein
MTERAAMVSGERRAALCFVAPALILLLVFIVLPFLLAIALSLSNLRMGSPLPLEFVGWREYARILVDPSFLRALANNAVFATVVVPLQTLLALGLALLLNHPLRGIAIFRGLFFLPVIFPLSLVAVVWVLLLAPGPDGLVNALLAAVSLGAWAPRDFLNDPAWALLAVMVVSVWQGVGFQMIVLLAGLQGIARELYEAAQIDGASAWQRFRYVTLPQLRNPLVFVVIVTSILSFRVFDQVRVMTQGGPNDASTTVIFEAVQAAFDRAQVARGSAMAVVFFLIVLLLALLQRRLLPQTHEVQDR